MDADAHFDCKVKNTTFSRYTVAFYANLATQFGDYAKMKQSQIADFENYELMRNLLGHISRLNCEVPCRQGGDGCIDSCRIIECVKKKSVEGCWECTDYVTCEKLGFLKPFHGDTPVNNLHKIKKLGIHAWEKHRGKCYPWSK